MMIEVYLGLSLGTLFFCLFSKLNSNYILFILPNTYSIVFSIPFHTKQVTSKLL